MQSGSNRGDGCPLATGRFEVGGVAEMERFSSTATRRARMLWSARSASVSRACVSTWCSTISNRLLRRVSMPRIGLNTTMSVGSAVGAGANTGVGEGCDGAAASVAVGVLRSRLRRGRRCRRRRCARWVGSAFGRESGHISVYLYMCICMCVDVHLCICLCIHLYIYNAHTHIYICTCIHTYEHTYRHTSIHAHTHL